MPNDIAKNCSQKSISVSWRDLQPSPYMIKALDYADNGSPITRDNQNEKRRWSELLADACAWKISEAIRNTKLAKGLIVLPEEYGLKSEPVILLGDSRKAVDVAIVTKRFMGLQVGFSLKGFNTIDGKSKAYDKNLRGRISEITSENLFIHTYLPMAKMVTICYMPIEAAYDKTSPISSTFSRAVDILDRHTGRSHHFLNPENSDRSFIALYSRDDSLGVPRGVLRFFDVSLEPQGSGLPVVSSTYSLEDILENHCFLNPSKRGKQVVPTEQLNRT